MKNRFRVKELAEARGYTQEELAAHARQHGADVSLATVQRIWQNNRAGDPRSSTLLAIARALGVRVEDLYSDGNQGYTNEHIRTPMVGVPA